MVAVDFSFEAPYLTSISGKSFPGLIVTLENAYDPSTPIEVRASLDSGAEYSLFDGQTAQAIGLDLISGAPFTFVTTGGATIDARILPVVVRHSDLAAFKMDLRFSTGKIRRDILGRDFFNLVQVGFRERHLRVYLSATP